jgi:hypothetical protein
MSCDEQEGSYLPTTCRHIRVVKVQLHSFLTFALHGGELCHWWLYPCGKTPFSIGGWVGQKPVWTFGEQKNILPLPGFECWMVQPVA